MEKKIINALKKVIDPELGINIVDLGLIYNVKVKDNNVEILMTLTSPGCPLAGVFEEEVTQAVKKVSEVKKVKVKLTFEPLWNPQRISTRTRRQHNINL